MIVYADTSALTKLILLEPGSEDMRDLFQQAERTMTVELAYVELRAAVAAAERAGRSTARREEVRAKLEEVWRQTTVVDLGPGICGNAGDLAEQHALRGYDAVHLATLMLSPPTDIFFGCWDKDLRLAAGELGYRLVPQDLP